MEHKPWQRETGKVQDFAAVAGIRRIPAPEPAPRDLLQQYWRQAYGFDMNGSAYMHVGSCHIAFDLDCAPYQISCFFLKLSYSISKKACRGKRKKQAEQL
jgi:hypothetical protein